ncbi:hypothetical protein FPQ18DRAFT_374722 [Pyronema domesticum]|nr:hypothetical protein FPQ18DRAFT_374722 [Pyronema domesticum]
MSIHDSWEDLPQTVMGYCSDDANMEAEGGKGHCSDDAAMVAGDVKLAKDFSDREVAVDLGPDHEMTEENSLGVFVILIINEEKRDHKSHRLTRVTEPKLLSKEIAHST